MREIKFRGQRLDNGKWVYGMFYALNNHPLDVERYGRKHSYYFERILTDNEDNEGRGSRNLGEVAPETIGQYTGLKDRNGTDIYEGDIISAHQDLFHTDSSCVYWEDGAYVFDDGYPLGHIQAMQHVVIGNIYENPELLTK